jgi:hypothetical protein
MKRLLRWAFNLAAAVSAVLLALVVGMWFRDWRSERVYFLPGGAIVHVRVYEVKPIDYGLLVLLLGLMPAVWAILSFRARRRHQLRPGLCRRCGYDLRATPDRCPECGKVPNDSKLSIRQSKSN